MLLWHIDYFELKALENHQIDAGRVLCPPASTLKQVCVLPLRQGPSQHQEEHSYHQKPEAKLEWTCTNEPTKIVLTLQ